MCKSRARHFFSNWSRIGHRKSQLFPIVHQTEPYRSLDSSIELLTVPLAMELLSCGMNWRTQRTKQACCVLFFDGTHVGTLLFHFGTSEWAMFALSDPLAKQVQAEQRIGAAVPSRKHSSFYSNSSRGPLNDSLGHQVAGPHLMACILQPYRHRNNGLSNGDSHHLVGHLDELKTRLAGGFE